MEKTEPDQPISQIKRPESTICCRIPSQYASNRLRVCKKEEKTMNHKSKTWTNTVTEIERKTSNWVERCQNLPEAEKLSLHNENRASMLNSEIAQLDQTLHWVETVMTEFSSEHEQYLCDGNGICYRHRDHRSVENTKMMFGPHDPCLEDWMAVLRNDLLDCKNELSRELAITEKGDIGEENVFDELSSHYPTLSNIVLDIADEAGLTNETDFYAILPHGVAVIEVKNYGKSGQRIWVKDTSQKGVSQQEASQWEITTKDGHHISNKDNPFLQNKRHVKATHRVLKGLLNKEIPLFSVVVLGNNHVQIMNDTDLVVTNPRGLCSALGDLTSDVTLTEQEKGIIMRHLQSLNIGSRAFSILSYRKRNEHIYQLVREIIPILGDNHVIRTRYYADRKKKNNRLAAVPIGILVLVAIIFQTLGAVITCLLCMSLLISAVAVLSQTLRRFFPRLGMPKQKKLVQELNQDRSKAISADPNGWEAKVGAFNCYLLTDAKRYPINFDVTIPLDNFPERYISLETLKYEIAQAKEQSAAYIKDHFDLDDFDIYDLEAIYKMTGRELTLGFQMIRHMCNQNIGAFVSLHEAEQYYQNIFQKTSFVSSCLFVNVMLRESGPNVPIEELPLIEELGVRFDVWCRNSNHDILTLYRDELTHAQKVLTMLAECHHYAHYLLDLGVVYYEHCGVVVNDEGDLFEVSDWDQTLDHFRQLLMSDRDSYEITSAEFLKAVV